jgi:hypothetical protein
LPNPVPILDQNDRNETGRRALVQILALRAWALSHDGRLPDRLEQLVPDELPALPVDPFSGQPFGYVYRPENWSSQNLNLEFVHPLGRSLERWQGIYFHDLIPAAGHWLLYSWGPNLVNDQGELENINRYGNGDIIFALRAHASAQAAAQPETRSESTPVDPPNPELTPKPAGEIEIPPAGSPETATSPPDTPEPPLPVPGPTP